MTRHEGFQENVNQPEDVIVAKPLSQSFFYASKDTFFIREHFDLQGRTISTPSGATLLFDGGSLRNWTVVFRNSSILGKPRVLTNVEGTIANKVLCIDWFLDSNDVYQLFERGIYKLANNHILSFSTKEYVMSSLLNADNDLVLHNVVFDGNNCVMSGVDIEPNNPQTEGVNI